MHWTEQLTKMLAMTVASCIRIFHFKDFTLVYVYLLFIHVVLSPQEIVFVVRINYE